MIQLLRDLRKKVAIGFVGGSDLDKIKWQLEVDGLNGACNLGSVASYHILYLWDVAALNDFDFAFAENGLTAYRMGKQLGSQSFIEHLGEENYKYLVNFILRYLSGMDVPIKRYVVADLPKTHLNGIRSCSGTFVEYRNGMINVSPIGRNASYVPFGAWYRNRPLKYHFLESQNGTSSR